FSPRLRCGVRRRGRARDETWSWPWASSWRWCAFRERKVSVFQFFSTRYQRVPTGLGNIVFIAGCQGEGEVNSAIHATSACLRSAPLPSKVVDLLPRSRHEPPKSPWIVDGQRFGPVRPRKFGLHDRAPTRASGGTGSGSR